VRTKDPIALEKEGGRRAPTDGLDEAKGTEGNSPVSRGATVGGLTFRKEGKTCPRELQGLTRRFKANLREPPPRQLRKRSRGEGKKTGWPS